MLFKTFCIILSINNSINQEVLDTSKLLRTKPQFYLEQIMMVHSIVPFQPLYFYEVSKKVNPFKLYQSQTIVLILPASK